MFAHTVNLKSVGRKVISKTLGSLMHYNKSKQSGFFLKKNRFKDIYFAIYGIISEFTDMGQFQYLTKLKGPQMGNYLYTTQILSLR